MNYQSARQMTNGKWHYTNTNGNHVRPMGYCSPITTCPKCNGHSMFADPSSSLSCDNCKNKGVIDVEVPCPGHDTEEEACEHYRQYELDRARYNVVDANAKEKCVVCGEWTQTMATVDCYRTYRLCESHCNRDALEKLYPAVGDCWSS